MFTPGPDWVQPWWLARQRDPAHGAYHPGGAVPVNAVGRSWTMVGTLDGSVRTPVDPRGLVVGRAGRWSLDWWVGSGERWLFPSMIPGVRQRLVDGAPVVETLLRVGGGEVVQRCFGANAQLDVVAVEFENRTSGPVALALAVRPYDIQGGGRINQARCDDRVVEIDGEAALVLERRPGAVVTGTGGMDPASRLDLLEEPDGAAARWLTCGDGSGAMAMVLPLVHGATMRVAILPPGCGVSDVPPDVVDRLPTGEQVARGWGRHATSGCRVVLPAGRIAEGFDAVRQSLPLAVVGGSQVEPAPFGPPADADDLLDTVSALAELGYAAACRDVLVAWAHRQDRLGATMVQGMDVTAVSLLALDHVHSLHPDADFLAALSEVVADAARWLLQQDGSPTGRRALGAAHHLLSEVGAIRAAAELDALGHGTKPDALPEPEISELLREDRSRPLGYDVLATAKTLVEDIAHQRTVALDRLDARGEPLDFLLRILASLIRVLGHLPELQLGIFCRSDPGC